MTKKDVKELVQEFVETDNHKRLLEIMRMAVQSSDRESNFWIDAINYKLRGPSAGGRE